MIRRWRIHRDFFEPVYTGYADGRPPCVWWCDGHPYVADCRSVDIFNTIRALIRNAPGNMVAISLRPDCYRDVYDLKKLERTARRRGARIIWLPPGRAVMGEESQHD